MESSIYKDSHAKSLFLHCVLKANWKDKKFMLDGKKIIIKRGSFLTGRHQLSKDLGMKSSTTRNKLRLLVDNEYISIKPTYRYSIIIVKNYDFWQKTGFEYFLKKTENRTGVRTSLLPSTTEDKQDSLKDRWRTGGGQVEDTTNTLNTYKEGNTEEGEGPMHNPKPKNEKEKVKPDPHLKIVITHILETWSKQTTERAKDIERYNASRDGRDPCVIDPIPCPFSWGKHSAIIKRLCQIYQHEGVMALWDMYLLITDPWIKERGYAVDIFLSQNNLSRLLDKGYKGIAQKYKALFIEF